MFGILGYLYQQKKAARYGVTLTGIADISSASHLIMEENARIKEAVVDLPEKGTPLRIGAFSYIRSGSQVQYVKEIGRFCSIGRNVVLGETPRNHPVNWVSTSMAVSHQYVTNHQHVVIGHDVWIAHDAVIMAGVKIGTGAVVARNAIVTRDVEPYQIVGGNPARPLRYRFDEAQREALLKSEWWNLDYATLRGLPFHDVDALVAATLADLKKASYRKIEIRKRRVTLLK
ncbi:MAG: CatB-related O-acetyltransferase [Gammaproteobacteria bacterium]|nr:CatB-related O-acetyltransferase [Gammaproteobacteria bacterium]